MMLLPFRRPAPPNHQLDQLVREAALRAGTPVPGEARNDDELLRVGRHALAVLADALATARAAEPPPAEKRGWDSAPVALELAGIRERLRDVSDGTNEVYTWLLDRLDVVLGALQVTEFTDDGPLVPQRHRVVRTTPGEPAGRIAATTRPGLRLGEGVLRPQDVVIFEREDEAQ
ncbi:hypothetical protein KBX03_03235 [Micromonospora sp. C72]|uniref:hypothetical protein n=1 Tax=Micromonospora sp. C72 TaxID=2824880 RepID=UPI001B38350E|nr:hypothetical protein [Micromonospora sp. C72]MBQ1041513.1 hypothetical protein [Micromonospora sp. C72]